MNSTAHKCGGVALASVATLAFSVHSHVSIAQGIMLITGATFGALLPDIDHKGSEVGKKLKPISKIICENTEHRGFTHTFVCAFIVSMFLIGVIGITKSFYHESLISRLILGGISGFLIWIALDTALNSMRPKFVHNKKIKKLLDLEYPSLIILVAICTIFSSRVYDSLDMFAWGAAIGYISHIILDLFNPMGVPVFYPISKHRVHIANIKTGTQEGIVSAICNVVTVFVLVELFIL